MIFKLSFIVFEYTPNEEQNKGKSDTKPRFTPLCFCYILNSMNINVAIICLFLPLVLLFPIFKSATPGFHIRYGLIGVLTGLAALIPIVVIQFAFAKTIEVHNLSSMLLSALFINGVIEEGSKMLCMAAIPSKKQDVGAFLACAILAGFTAGSIESVIYMIHDGSMQWQALRLFSAVLIHPFCAGLGALFVRFCRHRQPKIPAVFFAVMLHGLYDFFTSLGFPFKYFAIITILFSALEVHTWYARLCRLEHPERYIEQEN